MLLRTRLWCTEVCLMGQNKIWDEYEMVIDLRKIYINVIRREICSCHENFNKTKNIILLIRKIKHLYKQHLNPFCVETFKGFPSKVF